MIVLVFLAQTLRIAVPYLFAASGGVIAERAGVISLTLEGLMLGGAFGSALAAYYTDSVLLAILIGILTGTLTSLFYGWAVIRFRADQVVVGIALNLLVMALTRFFLQLAFDSASNSPRVEGIASGSGTFGFMRNPLVWAGLLAMPFAAWLLNRTVFGLRVRAAGEHPEAVTSVGVSVARVRYLAVALCGGLSALGGVYLALDQHQFTDQMTAGRGFIAIAAVIFGRWEPVRAGIACLLFAAAEALQIQLQGAQILPSQFVTMIPYVLTVVALVGVVGRAVAPAALGKPA
jgi:general nucleoside transport system permease protein